MSNHPLLSARFGIVGPAGRSSTCFLPFPQAGVTEARDLSRRSLCT